MSLRKSSPFSLTEFQLDLASSETDKLLRWVDCDVTVAFVRDASKNEKPATIQDGNKRFYAASTRAEVLHSLFSGASLDDGTELVIKVLSLGEIARNAYEYLTGIYLSDDQTALRIPWPTIALLGATTTVQDPTSGKKATYLAEAFSFETIAGVDPLPFGSVQHWRKNEQDNDPDYDMEAPESLYVFDDQLDWNNTLLPGLPDDARGVSKLPANARTFFNRTKVPLLPRWDGELLKPSPSEQTYQNELIGVSKLQAYSQLRALFDQYMVPPAKEITLTATKAEALDFETADSLEGWDIRIDFTVPMPIRAFFESNWTEASLCKANPELPDRTGTQTVSQHLRERILNHLAWTAFQSGRNFDMKTFADDLSGLLPDYIHNSSASFQPDYTDSRFPCLARFQCGKHEVPVLLLSQEGRNYVCQVTQDVEIPAADCPTHIPKRDALIYEETQSMSLSADFDKVIIPASLIDFPDHWFRGVRVRDQYRNYSSIAGIRLSGPLRRSEAEDVETDSAGGASTWGITTCAIILIGLVVLFGLF